MAHHSEVLSAVVTQCGGYAPRIEGRGAVARGLIVCAMGGGGRGGWRARGRRARACAMRSERDASDIAKKYA